MVNAPTIYIRRLKPRENTMLLALISFQSTMLEFRLTLLEKR